MTGAELRAARKAAGLSQTALAQRAGLSRDTVHYWEAKGEFRRCGAGQVLAEALGLMVTCTSIARARG